MKQPFLLSSVFFRCRPGLFLSAMLQPFPHASALSTARYALDKALLVISASGMHYRWLSPTILFSLLVEFTDIVMMRKCMLGIRQRAERASRKASVPVEAVTEHQVR
jgi:hypothetical protein